MLSLYCKWATLSAYKNSQEHLYDRHQGIIWPWIRLDEDTRTRGPRGTEAMNLKKIFNANVLQTALFYLCVKHEITV